MTASTPTAGSQGIFKISTVAMIQVQTIELTSNGTPYDITTMTGLTTPAWQKFLAGLLNWTVKVTGFLDLANDAVQATLWSNFTSGTVNAISYSPNAGTNAFTGNAFITSVPIKGDVKAVTTIEFDMQGTDELTYA